MKLLRSIIMRVSKLRLRVALIAAGACSAIAVSPVEGALLTATEDNFVWKGGADTTPTTGTTLTVKVASETQTNARFAYLKFNLSSLLPEDGNNATFSITTSGDTTTSYTFRAFALNAGEAGFNWTEGGITYNNRPAFLTTGFLIDPAKTTALDAPVAIPTATAGGTTVSFSFSGLSDYRQTDGTMTVIFLASAQGGTGPQQLFFSSEGTTPPTLNVPEPAMMSVLAVGAMGLLARRRQR
jgi:hypothetical protein